jgi:hypothetical protein
MRLFLRLFFLFVLAVFSRCELAKAEAAYVTFPSDVDWVTRDSPHFYALYRRGNERLAERALRAAEKAYRLLSPIFPPGPEHTWIVLADFVDSTNGYSLDLPWPHIVIFVSPPEASGQLSALDDWLDSVILHEYTHTLHIYPASGLWSIMRTVFGSWVLPNALMPSHFHEGLAVLMETEKTKGGRGRGTEFSMYRRMAVESKLWGTDDFFSRDQMDGSIAKWPGGTSAYFFGYEMWKELYARKGEKGIHDMVLSQSSNWPFFQGGPLNEVYKTDFPTLWADIFKKNETEARAEIDQIKREPLTNYRPLTHSKFSKWDIAVSPDGKQVAYRRWNPQDGPAIDILDLKTFSKVLSIPTAGNMAEGICWGRMNNSDMLVYIEGNAVHGYLTNLLRFYTPSTKKGALVENINWNNAHGLACSPSLDRLIVYQERAGKGVLKEHLIKPGKDEEHFAGKVGRQWKIPEGSYVTSVLVGEYADLVGIRDKMTTAIYRWPHNEEAPQQIIRLKGNFYNFRRGSYDAEILAIADRDARQEIWALDLKARTMKKKIAVLGGINSFEKLESQILFSNYTHGGYDIANATPATTKVVDMPLVADPKPDPGEPTPISAEHEYNPIRTVLPTTWIPNILFVPNGVQFGVWIPGFDVSQKHVYTLIGGYDWRITQGLPFVDLTYEYRFGKDWNINSEVYYAPSYFLYNQIYLKQWGGTVGVGAMFDIFHPYATQIGLNAVYKRMEGILDLPSNQSVGLSVSLTQKIAMKQRPLSISTVQGMQIVLSHSQFFQFMGSNDNYFADYLGLDNYFENPFWREHVLYIGSRFGFTQGTSFLNSYYTSGGELIFQQGRANFLNRGFDPQTFYGRRMATFNVEYRFPIARIDRGVGYWPFKLNVLHAALVADTTTTDNGISNGYSNTLFQTFYTSAGAELKSEWTFSSYLPVQLRLGAYHGFGPLGEEIYITFGLDASL